MILWVIAESLTREPLRMIHSDSGRFVNPFCSTEDPTQKNDSLSNRTSLERKRESSESCQRPLPYPYSSVLFHIHFLFALMWMWTQKVSGSKGEWDVSVVMTSVQMWMYDLWCFLIVLLQWSGREVVCDEKHICGLPFIVYCSNLQVNNPTAQPHASGRR